MWSSSQLVRTDSFDCPFAGSWEVSMRGLFGSDGSKVVEVFFRLSAWVELKVTRAGVCGRDEGGG